MPKLLVITSVPTHPTNAGNRARVRTWLETYAQEGVDFHLVFFRQEPGDEAAMAKAWGTDRCTFLNYQFPARSYTLPQRVRRRLGRAVNRPQWVPYGIDDWRSESLVKAVRELAGRLRPTCVQVEYVFYSHLFECFDRSVFKILDTHDIVAGREQLFLRQGREPEWFYTTRRQEAKGLNRADCIVAIQEQENVYFKGLTKKPVVTAGHVVELKLPTAPATGGPTAVFMGSANSVNEDALSFLLEKIWPLVRAAVPAATLEVYGRVCVSASAIKGLGVAGVRLEGEVADISQAYERAWLILCPLRFGTGLKIKSIEALGQGKPLVSTTAGCTGIEDGAGKAFLCGDSAEAYASHCINLLTKASLRTNLEHAAYEYASGWNLKQRNHLLQVMALAGLR